MLAPTVVTPDQIQAAAAELAEKGRRITGWALRRVVGAGGPAHLEAIWRD